MVTRSFRTRRASSSRRGRRVTGRVWHADQLTAGSKNALTLAGPKTAIPFTAVRGTRSGPVALVMAGVHGDEYEGPGAVQDVARELDPEAIHGTLILVPVANPRSFATATRLDPADGRDLNRSFPGSADGGITAHLAHVLFENFVRPAQCVLSMHGWSKDASVVPYAEYPEGDFPAAVLSKAAAEALGFGYVHPYRWPRGVLGEAATPLGIAVVETEIGGLGMLTREGQAMSRDVILRFLDHFGVLPANLTAAAKPVTIGHAEVVATTAGLFRSAVELSDAVGAGSVLGTIHSIGGELLETVRAPHVGLVGMLRRLASVQPGQLLMQIFRERDDL